MKTDAAFCSTGGGKVRRIMENRRVHGECAVGEGGCEVVVGANCGGRRGWGKGGMVRKFGRKVGRMGGVEASLVMWVIGLLFASVIVNFCFAIRLYMTNF